ncbi:hypothetical protein, partial [Treponema sp. UBA753]
MKKITKILSIFAVFALAFSFAGCSSDDDDSNNCSESGASSSGQVSENFVKIPAASIDGTENWTPESKVFV